MEDNFLVRVTNFFGRRTPEEGMLVGYSLLINIIKTTTSKLVPLPIQLCLISSKTKKEITEEWILFPKSYAPDNDIISHLFFALKYEGLDLFIIKNIFKIIGPTLIINAVNNEPLSQYSRKVWFLYEWLMEEKLDLPDLETGSYVKVLNTNFQYEGESINSKRHRIKNNLPGTVEFCPLIQKTKKLEQFISQNMSALIEQNLSKLDKELVRRTAAFLLLKDSKASFEIEGEYPPDVRARNWGKAIGQAGKNPLTIEEIERLQHLVFGNKTLQEMGIRKIEGFIGEHDRRTLAPIPDHISAKSMDLESLMNGLMDTNYKLQKSSYDAILTATTIAFGFVFIHPLTDGNGRIHRYIIHHILAAKNYIKRDLIFPISSAILDKIGMYQEILEDYTASRLEWVEWKPSPQNNVEILNETIDLYRYGNLTKQAEFLYECVEDTIKRIIPEELTYLHKYDLMTEVINRKMALPNTKVDLLIKLLHQNNGKLSKVKQEKYFDELTVEEIEVIESDYKEIWE